jgi:hypothetical protein
VSEQNDVSNAAEGNGAASGKVYQHVQFQFRRSSMLLDGKYFEVTAFLLVPKEVLPEIRQWQDEAASRDKQAYGKEYAMYKSLLAKGCLLHREDGPAYIETEKAIYDDSYIGRTHEEYWHRGGLRLRPLPDDGIRRLRLPTGSSDLTP